ncbi:hypothetical protein IU421_24730 [Nocardia cyriacigeorgica]|uniref:hypothetical protein n=1 Tax=Nocardia cyriacigeorgica TaxID=135487 RepID=UPI001895843B|nr:hypothetical protein [Nocardia cyriacigeorgica]MBF6163078.1 hypothetical protein [Nocardia cyriacigeorgica]MBF6202046.1 hypothetical protein [Nocardia cyriacigeorgica]MBF6318457.1 hypothetical protein [Nocardia cyriacigeorgica]MBF6517464.1 hypothetical protein [Nocardia cyriacigeorgica]MBF6533875.1 hypothetical protein [Nocardia cyriacigeorgica]
MNTTTKFAGFALGLAAVFGIALGLGAAVGPEPSEPAGYDAHAAGSAITGGSGSAQLPGGLVATEAGYTLALDNATTTTSADAKLRFRILDETGAPVTRYVRSHDKDLHLIVVRRDMAAFQHVHPELDANGTWSVPLNLSRAGDYRVYADFTPEGGEALTLGADLRVAGQYDVQPLPAPATNTTVGDYTVTLNGAITPGQASKVTLSVSRNGQSVTDLQPYLGAYGHLVALRASDLAYLHVHPEGEPGDGVTAAGPGITFYVTAPTTGDYRLFLDFQHEGVVRTAEFTATAGPASTTPAPGAGHGAEQPGHGH